MKLLSATLTNVRKHRELSVEFPNGLIAITGPTGAGKTAVFEAIAWALVGSGGIKGGQDAWVRRGAKPKDCRVDLTVEVAETVYRIARTIGGCAVYDGERTVATGSSASAEYIQKLIGMTQEEFFATYYTSQKELAFLKNMGGADRGRFLARLLGYDKLRTGQKVASAKMNKIGGRLAFAEESLATMQIVTDETIREAEELQRGAELFCGQIEKMAGACQMQLSVLTRQAAGLQQTALARAAIEQRIAVLEGEVLWMTTELDTTKTHLESEKARYERITEPKVEIEETLGRMVETRLKLIAEKNRLDEEDEEARSLLRESLKKPEENVAIARAALAKISDAIRTFGEDGGGVCPTCLQEVTMAHLLEIKADAEKDLATADRWVAEIKAVPLVLNVDEVAEELRAIGRVDAEIVSYQAQLTIIKDAERQLAGVEKRLAENATDARRQKIDSTQAMLVVLRDELSKTPEVDEVKLKKVEARRVELEKNQKSIQVSEKSALGWKSKCIEALKVLCQERERRERYEKIVAEEKHAMLVMDSTVRAFNEVRVHLNDTLRPAISEKASSLVSTMSEGRFSTLELDEGYAMKLYDGDQECVVISGGEEDIAHLSMRLAVSELIAERSGKPMQLLMLDEILGSLDEQLQMRVVEQLRVLSETRFEQILLVSHTQIGRDQVDTVLVV